MPLQAVDALLGCVIEFHAEVPRRLAQHLLVIAVHAADVVDIRAEHELFFPALPVVGLKPYVGAGRFGAVHPLALAAEQVVLAVDVVEAGDRDLALLERPALLPADKARLRGRVLERVRERPAVPEQLRVVVFRVADRQVREYLSCI